MYGDDYPTPDGTGVRDYLHVMYLAEGHGAALAALNAGVGEPNAPASNLITVNLGVRQAARRLGGQARRGRREVCTSAWQWQVRSREDTVTQNC